MSSAKAPSQPSKDVIYIDVDDEITAIIDKVENASAKVVALVLPKRAASLQSIVNMKLLARSAEGAGKNPVLITSEAALLPLAGAAGLHVAKNLQSKPEIPDAPAAAAAAPASHVAHAVPEAAAAEAAEEDLPSKIDYNRSVGALAARHEAEHPETIDLDDEDEEPSNTPAAVPPPKVPKGNKNRVPNFDRFRLLLGLGGLAVIAIIIFIILAIWVLPKAQITLTTTATPVSANFNLTASTSTTKLDPTNGNIPAKLETTDQTSNQQVTATGQQNNGQTATGSVTMSAQTCAPNLGTPNDVPAGTGVSVNGLVFITQQDASFSYSGSSGGNCNNYSSNSTPITAQKAGAKYNTSINDANVSGRSDVSASGSANGGTDDIVTVLSQSDVDSAKQKLTSGNASSNFEKSFEDKLAGQGEYVLTSTMKAGDPQINASPAVGQPATTANVTIKITYTVLTVKKSDLTAVINSQLADQINKSKQKLSDTLLSDANITVQGQSSPNQAVLDVNENTTAVPIINLATVKKQAEGQKVGDIQAALSNWPGVKNVDVKLSPFWVSKAPKKDGKITVILKRVETTKKSNAQQP